MQKLRLAAANNDQMHTGNPYWLKRLWSTQKNMTEAWKKKANSRSSSFNTVLEKDVVSGWIRFQLAVTISENRKGEAASFFAFPLWARLWSMVNMSPWRFLWLRWLHLILSCSLWLKNYFVVLWVQFCHQIVSPDAWLGEFVALLVTVRWAYCDRRIVFVQSLHLQQKYWCKDDDRS